jgi:peptidoglycan/xylan/chitin deacetylase (PgdA/CDA1 family)
MRTRHLVLLFAIAMLAGSCATLSGTATPPAASGGLPSHSSTQQPSAVPTESPSTLPTAGPTATATASSSQVPNPTNPPVPCTGGVKLASASGPAAPLVRAGSRSQRVIAITVDDGASDAAVLADLGVFEQEHVNATFFPIGEYVEGSPNVWREVAAAGFPIGNHTYDHRNLECLSYLDVVADIERDNTVVSRIIGEPLLPILRPPGGYVDTLVLQAADAAGERYVVKWDTDDGDTARNGDNVPLIIANAEKGGPGSILLVHANRPYTQQALPAIIAFYRTRGFAFVTLGQMLGIEGPVPYRLQAEAGPTGPRSV